MIYFNFSEKSARLIPVFVSAVLIGIVSSCSRTSSSTDEAMLDLAGATFADQDSNGIVETYRPLESFSVDLSVSNVPDLVTYESTTGDSSLSQVVWSDSQGNIEQLLIMPQAIDYHAETLIKVGGVVERRIVVEPLPSLSETDAPGEYSLNAMNSILFGLKDQITQLELQLGEASVQNSIELVQKLNGAVETFQQTIEMADNVAYFNSTIYDPLDGSVVLDIETLELLDKIFLGIFSGLFSDGILLDDVGFETPVDDVARLNFREFSEIAKARMMELEGVYALASLSIFSNRGSDSDQRLKSALNFVQASIAPALLSNWIENRDVAGEDKLAEYVSVLIASLNLVGGANYVYEEVLKEIEFVSQQVQI